jgi:peptidoglycan/xylan/chitin deacetylase (PgdA/CDA1 family)
LTIKKIGFGVINLLSPLTSAEWLIKQARAPLVLPFYHLVTNDERIPIHIKHLYTPKTSKQFEKDLDFFLRRYTIVDIDDLKSGKNTKDQFYLTFDDGLQEFYTTVAPILSRKGLPATCFINSAFVDNRDIFFRYKASILIEKIHQEPKLEKQDIVRHWLTQKNATDLIAAIKSVQYGTKNTLDTLASYLEVDFSEYLSTQQPYMTTEQIKSVISQGFTIGAHSVDHPLFASLHLQEQVSQTADCLQWLETKFGIKEHLMSFPFTDHGVGLQYFRTIRQHYPDLISFGTAGLKNDCTPYHYQRIPMETNECDAEKAMKHEYLYFLMKALIRSNTIART